VRPSASFCGHGVASKQKQLLTPSLVHTWDRNVWNNLDRVFGFVDDAKSDWRLRVDDNVTLRSFGGGNKQDDHRKRYLDRNVLEYDAFEYSVVDDKDEKQKQH